MYYNVSAERTGGNKTKTASQPSDNQGNIAQLAAEITDLRQKLKQIEPWQEELTYYAGRPYSATYQGRIDELNEKIYDMGRDYALAKYSSYGILGRMESVLREKEKQYASLTGKPEQTWFQKGAFEDGYQFGNFTKSVIATGRDLGENVLTGLAGFGEKALDALIWAAPYIAQGQYYQNGGGYNLQADRAFQAQNDAFKVWSEETIQKDLYDEEKVAEALMQNDVFEKITGIDTDKDSFSGEKLDNLARSGGGLAGTAVLTMLGVPAGLTIFATSFGGEVENALRQGATMEEAGLSGAITAGAELLTEKFSSAINLLGGKTVTDVVKKEIARAVSSKTAQTLLDLGVEITGEGFEEVLTEVISTLGQKLTYMDEESLTELITREDLWDTFIGGILMGSAGKGTKTGWDGREVVTEATGSSITMGRKKYEFLGYDKNGSPVYQDAEVLKAETAAENEAKSAEEAEKQTKKEQTEQDNEVEKNEQYGKIVSEIKEIGGFSENASVHIPPLKVMVEDLDFDDAHINGERGHNVNREMAETWIRESKVSVTVWNGLFEKYYGANGVVYVDRETNKIRTAFAQSEFDERTRKILEVLEKYGD